MLVKVAVKLGLFWRISGSVGHGICTCPPRLLFATLRLPFVRLAFAYCSDFNVLALAAHSLLGPTLCLLGPTAAQKKCQHFTPTHGRCNPSKQFGQWKELCSPSTADLSHGLSHIDHFKSGMLRARDLLFPSPRLDLWL